MIILIITAKWPRRVFGVTGGRPSSFQRSYEMGDPLAPSECEGNSGGGRLHPFVTPCHRGPNEVGDFAEPEGRGKVITRPGALESKKTRHGHSIRLLHKWSS
jgi:hypothetical protein